MILGRTVSESSGLLLLYLMRKINSQDEEDLQDWLVGDWVALFENKPPGVIAAVRDLVTNTALKWHVRCQGADVVLNIGLRQGAEALDTEIDWVAGLVSNESDEWPFLLSLPVLCLTSHVSVIDPFWNRCLWKKPG